MSFDTVTGVHPHPPHFFGLRVALHAEHPRNNNALDATAHWGDRFDSETERCQRVSNMVRIITEFGKFL
jgi:hypothetical protein